MTVREAARHRGGKPITNSPSSGLASAACVDHAGAARPAAARGQVAVSSCPTHTTHEGCHARMAPPKLLSFRKICASQHGKRGPTRVAAPSHVRSPRLVTPGVGASLDFSLKELRISARAEVLFSRRQDAEEELRQFTLDLAVFWNNSSQTNSVCMRLCHVSIKVDLGGNHACVVATAADAQSADRLRDSTSHFLFGVVASGSHFEFSRRRRFVAITAAIVRIADEERGPAGGQRLSLIPPRPSRDPRRSRDHWRQAH
jgi:hypothetical protein